MTSRADLDDVFARLAHRSEKGKNSTTDTLFVDERTAFHAIRALGLNPSASRQTAATVDDPPVLFDRARFYELFDDVSKRSDECGDYSMVLAALSDIGFSPDSVVTASELLEVLQSLGDEPLTEQEMGHALRMLSTAARTSTRPVAEISTLGSPGLMARDWADELCRRAAEATCELEHHRGSVQLTATIQATAPPTESSPAVGDGAGVGSRAVVVAELRAAVRISVAQPPAPVRVAKQKASCGCCS